MTLVINGKELAEKVRREVLEEASLLDFVPRLDVVLVGDNPASKVYVRMKDLACNECGINSVKHELPGSVSQEELLALVRELNLNPLVDGVLVQLPLPKHISEQAVINAINPEKDVDGFHPLNIGRLCSGLPGLRPCTPLGVIALLDSVGYEFSGKRAVIVGRSKIVGRPLAIMLSERDCTVSVCHSKTVDLASETRRAELLVVAVGKPGLIVADMVADGVAVIDVGVNRVGSALLGDVDFPEVSKKAFLISPVPGGVGPMTVAMLMKNTVQAAKARRRGELTVSGAGK